MVGWLAHSFPFLCTRTVVVACAALQGGRARSNPRTRAGGPRPSKAGAGRGGGGRWPDGRGVGVRHQAAVSRKARPLVLFAVTGRYFGRCTVFARARATHGDNAQCNMLACALVLVGLAWLPPTHPACAARATPCLRRRAAQQTPRPASARVRCGHHV